MAEMGKVDGYFEGLNRKLFDALPTAKRVLELGCANGRLGQAYKMRHPFAHWTGIDVFPEAVRASRKVLDVAELRDLDIDPLSDLDADYDLIVFGDLIEHIKAPLPLLKKLRGLVKTGGKLVCCIPNMCHHSVLTRVLIGDFSYDPNGLLDKTHTRLYSPASAIKLLLDAGWLPHLVDSYVVGGPQELVGELVRLSTRLGSSAEAAGRNLTTYQMIFDASPIARLVSTLGPCSVSVIVPVNSPLQYELNVARSPGLGEIGAELIPVTGAKTAAEAFSYGKARSKGDWLLFCHQDMYFPEGFGFSLAEKLRKATDSGSPPELFGFVGLDASDSHAFMGRVGYRVAGQIVDRTARISEVGTANAVALDECAIILPRGSGLEPDPKLGWHLWATDLAWQASSRRGGAVEILTIPAFHNSLTAHELPAKFGQSLQRLAQKYPGRDDFVTLCGAWSRQPSP